MQHRDREHGGWFAEVGAKLGIPVIASQHTRFETYLDYYRLGWARPLVEAQGRLEEVPRPLVRGGDPQRDGRAAVDLADVWFMD